MSIKEQLYYLLDNLLCGNYDIDTFCQVYTDIYCHHHNEAGLSSLEHKLFDEVNAYASRFSNIKEDRMPDNVYFDGVQVRQKVDEVIGKLVESRNTDNHYV